MDFKPFEKRVWLSSPTMHGEEQKWVDAAIKSNWVSTFGENLDEIDKLIPEKIGRKFAVSLSSGTAALHLAVKLCGEKLYGQPKPGHGTLEGHRVFCSDVTFAATANPIAYECGETVFIDSERDTWNMDPKALEKAFELYPDTKIVMLAHLYGTPAKLDEITEICKRHGALLIEDAAESFGATYKGKQTGSFGDVSAISFNGNKIITGSTGGMFFGKIPEDAEKVKKWSTQSRENVLWYHHFELGYNYRMSNVVAGVIRGQLPYLEEHIAQKKAIYERYKEGLKDLPITMNPFDASVSEPNYWLSCMLINEEAMCEHTRNGLNAKYEKVKGKTCPTEILGVLSSYLVEGRPIWRPMHMQPLYQDNAFVTVSDDVGADLFNRGLCLPSDNKMTEEEQESIIAIIHSCFN